MTSLSPPDNCSGFGNLVFRVVVKVTNSLLVCARRSWFGGGGAFLLGRLKLFMG